MRSWVVWWLLGAPLAAQDTSALLHGRVIDGLDSAGISGALVAIPALDVRVRTDGFGRFRLPGIRQGEYQLAVRAIGYDSLNVAIVVQKDSVLEIRMARRPQMLSQMNVIGRSLRVPRGFEDVYRRAGRGGGFLITREQIDSLNPQDLKTMLYPLPGLYVTDRSVYFPRCSPREFGQLWVDGQRMTKFRTGPRSDPMDLNAHLVGVRPHEVQAIEVYPSRLQIPGEFLDGQPCGVVAIWTRRGP